MNRKEESAMSSLAEAWLQREREIEQDELAKKVAGEVVSMLETRATVSATDVASRRREESHQWRDERNPRSESSDRIEIEESGESFMSDVEASGLLRSLRRKGKRTVRRTG